MVVKFFVVKIGLDVGGLKGVIGISSIERSVIYYLSSILEGFVGSVGIGDFKICWLVDLGVICYIVFEKWVKYYIVSFEYFGLFLSLKGVGDNDLFVKGVVDLEFKVGKTKIIMKRVVVVGIFLNVILIYVFLEIGWKIVFGNVEESGLFLKKLKFFLKIFERVWWLKVSLFLKYKSGVKGFGLVSMDLSIMNIGNIVNIDSIETK